MMRQISPWPNIENARFFTIIADETADVSNKEQVVTCIPWVDDCFFDTRRFHWNASFEKNKCRSRSSNTKECPTDNKLLVGSVMIEQQRRQTRKLE